MRRHCWRFWLPSNPLKGPWGAKSRHLQKIFFTKSRCAVDDFLTTFTFSLSLIRYKFTAIGFTYLLLARDWLKNSNQWTLKMYPLGDSSECFYAIWRRESEPAENFLPVESKNYSARTTWYENCLNWKRYGLPSPDSLIQMWNMCTGVYKRRFVDSFTFTFFDLSVALKHEQ